MKIDRLAGFGLLIFLLASCSSARQLTYFNDMVVNTDYAAIPQQEIVLRAGDIVNITVSSSDPTLAAPFNITQAVNMDALIADRSLELSQSPMPVQGYLIDEQGNIEFPILGTQRLEGKTLSQVRDMIADQIITNGYIKEPIVTADIKNFTYTIVGDVSMSNVYTVEGNNINIIQAIARSRDLNPSANLKDIRVIRTVDGKRTAYSLNILSKDIFDSPAFFLQQNDIVYVKRRGARLAPDTEFALRLMSTVMSVGSFVSTIWLLVETSKRY